MRLHLSLSPNTEPVPFEYQHFLMGAFHRWCGPNAIHDELSLYSLGWLQGGGARNGALHFPRGAGWFISAPDTTQGLALIEQLAKAAQNSAVCCGMEVAEMRTEGTPDFGPRRTFRADSPVLARGIKDEEGRVTHLVWDDPRAEKALTQTLRHKLDAAGLGHLSADARMSFDQGYRGAKTKMISIKGNLNRANFCPVKVDGGPEVVRFAWNVGAGQKTGCGFGSLV